MDHWEISIATKKKLIADLQAQVDALEKVKQANPRRIPTYFVGGVQVDGCYCIALLYRCNVVMVMMVQTELANYLEAMDAISVSYLFVISRGNEPAYSSTAVSLSIDEQQQQQQQRERERERER